MYWNTIDEHRKNVLKKVIASLPLEDYYMAGGTALSLQCGNRMSYDFDFFTKIKFDAVVLASYLSSLGNFKVIYEKDSTLHGILDGVNITFLYYPNPMIEDYVYDDEIEGLKYASIKDISVMKLVALSSRGSKKDYYDLMYMIKYKDIDIRETFMNLDVKFEGKNINKMHIVQSLTYFDDAECEPDLILMVNIDWEEIKRFFVKAQKELYRLVD
ncbi:MAG: nucleotidyl transferase AbiEii/AbiGii toxin family protein [Clostridia bacterium]|nr:nucleotidyl transferase AbiEii/AbiGii toxin family protein [Clostridia bacterium]